MTVRIFIVGLVLAIGAALAAPSKALAADKTIVVGQAIDLSGPNGSIGRDYVAGITTYFDSVNAKGGVNGRKITYIVRDDGGDAAESARQVTGLIRQDRSDYLLGAIGADATRAIVSAPAFVESRHLLFAPLADSTGTPRSRVLFWRPDIDSELRFLLDYFDKLGIKQVGLAYQESGRTRAAYQFAVAEIKRRGMTLTDTARIGVAGSSLAVESRRLAGSGARLVLAIADTISIAQFLKAFRQVDPATFVAGTSLTNLATLGEIAGKGATEFTVFSQVVPNPSSNASPLQVEHAEMMKKFRDEPLSSVTLEGFAVAKTLVRAMQMDAGAGGLQTLAAPGARIDLGGMTVVAAGHANNMSRFVEIALFQRGKLLF